MESIAIVAFSTILANRDAKIHVQYVGDPTFLHNGRCGVKIEKWLEIIFLIVVIVLLILDLTAMTLINIFSLCWTQHSRRSYR